MMRQVFGYLHLHKDLKETHFVLKVSVWTISFKERSLPEFCIGHVVVSNQQASGSIGFATETISLGERGIACPICISSWRLLRIPTSRRIV